ncbi:hypothetical protein EVG20_g10620 [Dentipellis fragilis]|uniref:Amine oxidase domain-containing protein n=1 Tax=Dentipellis fragilis TaxID=205917 RepID=A0A4Y9XUQ7_9AGAM|nr:hypothetical protein EVG20_g10620 [Dentipellis fragilis]
MILQDLGIDCEILEASERIGGRVYTHRFNGQAGYDAPRNTPARYDYFDVGAMRFPDIPFMERVFDLFKRVGVDDLLIDYHLGTENNLAFYNAKPPIRKNEVNPLSDPFKVAVANGGTVPDKYALVEGAPKKWISEAIDPYREKFREAYKKPVSQRLRQFEEAWDYLMQQDHHTTRGYMQSKVEPYPEPVVHWLETVDSGTGFFNYAFTETVIDSLDFDWPWASTTPDPEQTKETKWVCIDGGSDHLIHEMARTLKHQPLLEQRVTKLELLPGNRQIQVTGRSRNWTWARQYEQVICTVPLGCLGGIDTDRAGLSYNQRQAVRALQYGSSTKVGIKFARRWWDDPAVCPAGPMHGGQSSTDAPIRTCVYPSYGLETPSAPGVLMASYAWAQDAQRVGALAQEKGGAADKMLLELVLNDLEKIHGIPQKRFGPIEDHYAHNWDNAAFARGAFAHYGPGQFGAPGDDGRLFASIKAPAADGRLHIAGEATSVHHAWVLGALNSAWRAVYNLLVKSYPKKVDLLIKNWGIPDEENQRSLLRLAELAKRNVF